MSKSLWDIALKEREESERRNKEGKLESVSQTQAIENHVFVCGCKNSGKSTLLVRFLERDENIKPTFALDYTFGRRPRGHNMMKDVCHIWELGGSATIPKLIEVPITAHSIRNMSIILVLDLSKPNQLWMTQEILIMELRKRIDNVLNEVGRKDASLLRQLKERAWERIGANHPEKHMMNPFPVPFAIIGSKFDLFQELDAERKKMISKTLRFIAHTNGASIHFSSAKIESLMNRSKLVIGNFAFATSYSKVVSTDFNKPLVIPAGQDKLEDIGAPPVSPESLMKIKGGTPYDLWKQAYAEFFPPDKVQKFQSNDDPCKDLQFKENLVDAMRAQKDEELARYQKMTERKAREAELTTGSARTKRK